jgi:uncharacterized membrane protein
MLIDLNMSNVNKILLILLSVAGIVIMGYLLNLHFSSDTGGSFCDLGEGLSCDVVNKSEYAKVFGIPVSLLGLLYFSLVLLIALFKYNKKSLAWIGFISVAFMGPSLYLTYLEFYVINSICVLCEASKIIILGIILLSLSAARPIKAFPNKVVGSIVVGLLLIAGTFLAHNSGGVPSGTYDTFAQCLDEKGFVVYGSQGCSFCARQRALFGDSFEYIKEIECDVRYPDFNPQPKLCISKNIKGTPTWILEDEDGNDLFRFESGVVQLEKLSEVSGCSLFKDNQEE